MTVALSIPVGQALSKAVGEALSLTDNSWNNRTLSNASHNLYLQEVYGFSGSRHEKVKTDNDYDQHFKLLSDRGLPVVLAYGSLLAYKRHAGACIIPYDEDMDSI
eukprot:gnl/TRDRNA2_/TRDRNA2_168839_c0_seq1.p1 gnl/TRDRNA2_/TRDRNA2_168839_c0~~gnl/TRDRNA2_/TRDRNA2_168839_c0_seq1.p1  ORF type:complete len:117 (-),score=7.50 gnl/TRDRNA2_/TRDRNA2_168839_c0_seq1:8-322(-)